MNHEEIRFKILDNLYRRFFESGGTDYSYGERIASESGLSDLDLKLINAEIRYLEGKGFVKIDAYADDGTPGLIAITSFGCDVVEKIVDRSMNELSTESSDIKIKEKIDELKREQSPSERTTKIVDWAMQMPDAIFTLLNIAKTFLGN
ncbi:MAG: hypothetical protein ACREAG_08525 [Nitrosopumilaceae archaeon]